MKTTRPENMRKWIAALRSGKYDQGRGQLATINGYCCLGVACEISGLPYGASYAELPLAVRDWLGIESYNPNLLGVGACATVANDTLHMSFAEIADALEKTYL